MSVLLLDKNIQKFLNDNKIIDNNLIDAAEDQDINSVTVDDLIIISSNIEDKDKPDSN